MTYYYDNLTNAKGKLIKVDNSNSTTEYTAFDTLGRITSHKQTTATHQYLTSYSYYLNGALYEETYPSGRVVRNSIDSNGFLSEVQTKSSTSSFSTRAVEFSYNAAGAVTNMMLGNWLFETTVYNNRLQPTNIKLGTAPGSTNRLGLAYTYTTSGNQDNNGNILTQTITVPGTGGFTATQSYTYDALNRISTAAEVIGGSTSWSQTFGYDRYGNRNITAGTGVTNLTFGSTTNRITATGYTYDDAGNTTADPSGTKGFTYDGENKQVLSTGGGWTTGIYEYDGDGKRVRKYGSSTGDNTLFVYNAAGVLVEEYTLWNNPPTLVTSYVYAGSRLLSTETASGPNYLTADHLGSPRINTNSSGNVSARHDYMPFGEEITSSITSQRTTVLGYQADGVRKQFTGYERDIESELDFAQARMYNAAHGRFTSVDPYNIIYEAADAEKGKEGEGQKLFNQYISQPQNWNRYVYVWNNPLRNIDPDGEKVYVILYTTGNKEGDEEFRRVAETRKKDIENSKGFDPKKDKVLIQGVRNVEGVQSALNMANALDTTWGKVQQVALVSHGGPRDGPAFQLGTDNVTWAKDVGLANLTINWANDGEAVLLGCNTAVNFAQTFADKQGVSTWGFTTGTSFYSESNPLFPKGSGLLIRPGAYDYKIFNTPLYMKSQGDNPNGNFVRRTPRRY